MTYSVRRVDANQPAIVRALREAGASVLHLHTLGNGSPDLLVGYRGENFLIEVKSSGGRLTRDEEEFFSGWLGEVSIAKSPEEALRAIGIDTP